MHSLGYCGRENLGNSKKRVIYANIQLLWNVWYVFNLISEIKILIQDTFQLYQ